MVRTVVAVFSRICAVFGVYVLGLPDGDLTNFLGKHSSGLLERRVVPQHVPFLRNSATIRRTPMEIDAQETPFDRLRKFLKESPTTVDGSGLTLRYANVILVAEKLFQERNRVEMVAAGIRTSNFTALMMLEQSESDQEHHSNNRIPDSPIRAAVLPLCFEAQIDAGDLGLRSVDGAEATHKEGESRQ
ncbi:hypothetical protein ZIOFF_071158 [Zingiber officinale]|uniref:Uncharacterized protein n=1 Tax=Zingiber officinale TaxID=94328 RepID=A0A8J5CB58_ZINOF|nr:hypothetical protein ZIOFF_071158 [Zingiber officinale]